MAQPLDKQIASAMGKDARAADVGTLVTRIEGEITAAQAEREAKDALSKSATAAEDEADAAADEVVKLDRKLIRLEAKRDQMRTRHTELLESESRKRRLEEHAAVKARRDALAEELRTEWPELEARLVDLLDRIEASDRECAGVTPRLESAESIARGCPASFQHVSESGIAGVRYSRLAELKLPAFHASQNGAPAWPKPAPVADLANEVIREAVIKRKQAMAAEAERWKRYFVTPPDGDLVTVDTRMGPKSLRGAVKMFVMASEQVKAAEAKGCEVRLAKPGETLGLPMSGASF